MIRRLRDLRRLAQSMAEPYGATVTIGPTNGSHLKVTFAKDGRRSFVIASYSPSDRRADHRIRSDAHRALQKITAAPDIRVLKAAGSGADRRSHTPLDQKGRVP